MADNYDEEYLKLISKNKATLTICPITKVKNPWRSLLNSRLL